MSYNRWKPPEEELYHYGVLGMRWGVHKARRSDAKLIKTKTKYGLGDDFEPADENGRALLKSHKDLGKAYSDQMRAYRKLQINADNKLQKLSSNYEKRQAKTDHLYEKAERKAASLFTSKTSADRAFRKASKTQYKANRVALKGKRWYEQMLRSYKMAGIPMNESNRKIGEEFIRQVRANSRAMYAASYAAGR